MFKFFEGIVNIIGTVVNFVVNLFAISLTLIKQVFSSMVFLRSMLETMNAPFIVPTLSILLGFTVFMFVLHRGA